jgi:hypothetical protein
MELLVLREAVATSPEGIYAVLVTRNFYVSHQWLREFTARPNLAPHPIAWVFCVKPS